MSAGAFHVLGGMVRFALSGAPRKTEEVVIVYDHLGASNGETIAVTESREASMPFYPEKKVPLDAYCAAILDRVSVDASALKQLEKPHG